MYAAIDMLVDKLDRQIKKHKEKITDHHAREVEPLSLTEESPRPAPVSCRRVVSATRHHQWLVGLRQERRTARAGGPRLLLIDNIPVGLLRSFVDEILPRTDAAFENVGVGLDARNRPSDIAEIPDARGGVAGRRRRVRDHLPAGRRQGSAIAVQRDAPPAPARDKDTSLAEAIAKERELLGPIINTAELIIDTTGMTVYELREQIRDRIGCAARRLSILVESFGYKHGLPATPISCSTCAACRTPIGSRAATSERQGRGSEASSSTTSRSCRG